VKRSRLFWSFVLGGAVLFGGGAWLSAHRLSTSVLSAGEQERRSPHVDAARFPRSPRQAPSELTRLSDAPASAAGDTTGAAAPASGVAVQPTLAPSPVGAPTPAEASAVASDGVAAQARSARPKDAPRVNATSGELMWSARDVTPDGGRPDEPLCGGKVCPAGQFCCGPPACGRCAYPMAGPRCPSVCPGQKSN
jgi:hypothetical protein